MTKLRDIVVIGAGLSGASAALQAARSGFNVISLTKPADPGYWARVEKLHHIPGTEIESSGAAYIGRIKKQAETFGAVFHDFDVKKIHATDKRTFEVSSENGESYEAPVVIIASGVSKDEHFLAGEREMVGKGVFYSAENEAPFLRHQTTTVIGKSEEAARSVQYLSKFAEKVHFVIPSSKLDIGEVLLKDVEGNKKVELLFSSSIKKLNGADNLQSIEILSAGTEREIKSRSVFIYTYNLCPCSLFARGVVDVDDASGRVKVGPSFSTSVQGIFACGDILAGALQNPAVSVSQGMIAAMNAEKYLRA